MKIVMFLYEDIIRVGALKENHIVFLNDYQGNDSMSYFLQAGQTALDQLRHKISYHKTQLELKHCKLLAPIKNPKKFLAAGLNYAAHIAEVEFKKPQYPNLFNKQSSCIIGHQDHIHLPTVSNKLDYEGELGFIIGKHCRHVPYEKAHEVIAGFTIANDVSVRDWQMHSPTWTVGKSFDTHGPIGPYIVTADEIGDPHQLNIRTMVNGEERQNFNTSQMLFNCYELIAYLSTAMTLEPGDLILTGTGAGVGVKMTPRGYLKAGDTVSIEIEKIGLLENTVIEEAKYIQ